MTLITTVIAPWGIWQCSDHRLTDLTSGRYLLDESSKHVAFRCPDGGALLAYCGIGSVNNLPISTWVCEVLRGETRPLGKTFEYLRDQATISIGPIVHRKIKHMFSIGAFYQGKPYIIQIRNYDFNIENEEMEPSDEFQLFIPEAFTDPRISISGERRAITQQDCLNLARIVSKRPKKMENYHGLLAKFNKKASDHQLYGKFISASCTTSYMPPEVEPIVSKYHANGTRTVDIGSPPMLVYGIDASFFGSVLVDNIPSQSSNTSPPTSEEERDRRLREAAQEAVKPKNSLRRE